MLRNREWLTKGKWRHLLLGEARLNPVTAKKLQTVGCSTLADVDALADPDLLAAGLSAKTTANVRDMLKRLKARERRIERQNVSDRVAAMTDAEFIIFFKAVKSRTRH